ncbi:MAG: hypothetical protein ACKPE3_36415 [Sphaerospermopsis kisseleviana]
MGFADYPPISQNITGVRSQESGVRRQKLIFSPCFPSYQSQVTSPKSPVPSHQSQVTSPRSPITNQPCGSISHSLGEHKTSC